MDERAKEFWDHFLRETQREAPSAPYECFSFHNNEEGANALLGLVLSGQKRATTSSLRYYEAAGERPPRPGDLSVVTDWAGSPRCVIETESVRVLPFDEMTFELAALEGEDENLASWQDGHRRFFTAEGAVAGYAFSGDMPVVFETFRVVYTA